MDIKRKPELVNLVTQLVKSLSDKEQKILFENILSGDGDIPLSIFRSKLSGLEAIVIYLKDNKENTVNEISKLLNRKLSTIYTTYSKAKKKLTKPLGTLDYSILVPLSIFSNRKFSILESLVSYLRDERKLSWVKISQILGKKYSTIRTVYRRYKDKCQ